MMIVSGSVVLLEGDTKHRYIVQRFWASPRFGSGTGVELQREEAPFLKFPKAVDFSKVRLANLDRSLDQKG